MVKLQEEPPLPKKKPKTKTKRKRRKKRTTSTIPCVIERLNYKKENVQSCKKEPEIVIKDNRDIFQKFYNEIQRRKDLVQTTLKQPLDFSQL